MTSPKPKLCPPLTTKIRDEYKVLMDQDQAPALRAWIRETDKACRANASILLYTE